jgi:hypothetical protein
MSVQLITFMLLACENLSFQNGFWLFRDQVHIFLKIVIGIEDVEIDLILNFAF